MEAVVVMIVVVVVMLVVGVGVVVVVVVVAQVPVQSGQPARQATPRKWPTRARDML